jgi:hypothetical protein
MEGKTKRACVATTKRGPCRKAPILGGTVCATHGGSAPQVKAKAAERLMDLIDPNRALREAASLAYSDLSAFYDENGDIKPMKDWTPAMRAAVQSMETLERDITPGERGPAAKVHRLKLWDKPKNLEMLFKHLGLLVEKVQHSGNVSFTWQS